MKVIKVDEVPKELIDDPLFKGGQVSRQPIVPEDISPNFNMVMINFDKGAKNTWHVHDSDQVLLVTAGKGIVATEDEEREVEKGDIILVLGKNNYKLGDIIIFNAPTKHPLIHRIVSLEPISTKGDHNTNQLSIEQDIQQEAIIGKATLKIPLLGWIKLIFFEPFRPASQKGFCR